MKLQIPETNTREAAELDTSLFENNHYHQWELVMFCFSEWHYNTMVMFSVCTTMGLFSNLKVKWKTKIVMKIISLTAKCFNISDIQLCDWEKKQESFQDLQICTQRCTSTKQCETSSQHVFKDRLKQTKPDASIIGASESLIHRLVSAVNYSRTAFNSPCSSNLNHTQAATYTHACTLTLICNHIHAHAHTHTDTHTQHIKRRERKVNEMFSLGANYTKRNHVIICICGLYFPKLHSAVGSLTVGGLVGAPFGGFAV